MIAALGHASVLYRGGSHWFTHKSRNAFASRRDARKLAGGGAKRNHRSRTKPILRPGRAAGPGFAAMPINARYPSDNLVAYMLSNDIFESAAR
jgi:hypothetical protein